MPALFNLVSWNIQQFSSRHGERELDELITSATVKHFIAGLLLDQLANVAGIMEVTTGTGEAAIKVLVAAMNQDANAPGVPAPYASNVSDISGVIRGDKYAVIYTQTAFTLALPDGNYSMTAVGVSDPSIARGGVHWTDRAPFMWQVTVGSTDVTCLLWHAPQPKNNKKGKVLQELADLAWDLTLAGPPDNCVIAGDFNINTADNTLYAPLTGLGFVPVFAGQATTLSTLQTFIKNNAASLAQPYTAEAIADEDFLSSAYDNIFTRGVAAADKVRVLFPNWILQEIVSTPSVTFTVLSAAAMAWTNSRYVSDHLPLSVTIQTDDTPGSLDGTKTPKLVVIPVDFPEGEGRS